MLRLRLGGRYIRGGAETNVHAMRQRQLDFCRRTNPARCMSMGAVAHVCRMAIVGRCAVLVGSRWKRGMGPRRVCALLTERGLRFARLVHVRDRRFDPEEGEEENHGAGHEPPETQRPHCRYVNPMPRAFKPTAAQITVLVLGILIWGCGGPDREHSGEPVVRFRFRVDTIAPDSSLLPAMMSLGKTMFQSSCGTCHSQGSTARSGAPELTRSQWLARASYGEVVHFLAAGPHVPGEHLGTPRTGASELDLQELRAVALFSD